MQVMYIMQGTPGAGKSVLAAAIKADQGGIVCSTDDYFTNEAGEYNFDPAQIAANHSRNVERVNHAVFCGHDVIVDNTNIHRWEARPYVRIAKAYNVPVVFIRVTGVSFGSSHGVPQEKIDQMAREMEELTVESVLESRTPWELEEEEKTLRALAQQRLHELSC